MSEGYTFFQQISKDCYLVYECLKKARHLVKQYLSITGTGSGEIRRSASLIMNGAQHLQNEDGFISLDIGAYDGHPYDTINQR